MALFATRVKRLEDVGNRRTPAHSHAMRATVHQVRSRPIVVFTIEGQSVTSTLPTRLAVLLAIAISFAAGAVRANVLQRIDQSGAVNQCQGALPVADGQLRKRPLALVNEGNGSVFVTCSFVFTGAVTQVIIAAQDFDAQGRTLTCTGVVGLSGRSDNQFFVKSIAVSSTERDIQWFATDLAGSPTSFPVTALFNVSCSLPPRMGLIATGVIRDEDIGL